MSLYQQTVLKKQMPAASEKIREAYKLFTAYFHNPEIQENIRSSKEEQFQEGFLRELFVKILGYTLNPEPNYNLITEKKNETDSKKADGAIIVNGEVKAVIELKDHKTTDLKQVEAQAFGYKNNNRKTSYVIISNFEKLRFYIENTIDFEEFNLFELTEDNFAVLWICLAYENIASDLPKRLKSESANNEDQVTKQLYKEYSAFKRALFDDLTKHNPEYEQLTLFKKSQKLLDRLLFILFAEDCGLLPPNSIMEIIRQWETLKELDEYKPLYDRFKKYFGYMNTGHKGKKHDIFAYNGGLFSPDEVLDNIRISDEILLSHLSIISRYDFSSEVDVNILGHIFENSLTEIEEITNAISTNTELQSISKRKKDGVFYTPRYITTYIVENTLGKLCIDKKAELEIDESKYVTDKKRKKTQTKQLSDKLSAYREWLLSLTICDPACGSGAFLNAALDFLMLEHRYIDELTAKLFGNAIVFPNIENVILENNLYGVDINEESVEIAKLALWLRTAKPQRKLNSLNNNIKCGNSLISDPDVAGEKAFDWHKEFPQVFEKGGFDVVIGNPPYVIVFDKLIKEYLEKIYSIFRRNNDLYTAFISQSIENLLKDNGVISLITPNSYIRGDYFKQVRELLIKFRISEIIDFGNVLIFEDASVFSAIFTLVKNKMPSSFFLKKNIEDIGGLVVPNSSDFIPRNKVIEKMQSYKTFDKFFEIKDVGYNYWSIGRGKIRGNSIGSRILYSGGKRCNNDIPYVKGSNIIRYYLSAPQQYLLHNYNEYLNENDIFRFSEDFFNVSPKLIYRQTSSSLVGALDFEKNHNDKTVHIIVPKVDTKVDMRYVLALFNSTLLNYVYSCLTEEVGRAFAQVKTVNVKKLPFILAENQQPFIDLADKMLLLNSDLQAKRQRFLKRLSDNFSKLKITGALERFDEMEFKQFLLELSKQKITLSLKQQDEWEEYFNEYKTECTNLVNQINTTDKEIDRMVYELYGLTEEEVKKIN